MKYAKEPMRIFLKAPNGTYEVTLTVTAHEELTLTVYSQSRRFMVHDVHMDKGEKRDFVFDVSVCDYHKREEEYTSVEGINVDILCDGDFSAIAAASPVKMPVIYIAGDSTVTDQPSEYPYDPSSTYCGWGQMLPKLLKTGIAVENHSQSGACSEDFKQINFTAFCDKIKKGDMLIVEFGHNDQKVATLDAYGGYADNLRYFVNFARDRGAIPVICSPINRILFKEDGTLLNLLGEYRNAAKSVCTEMNVPFVDLWSKTTEFFEAAGGIKAWDYFWGDGVDRDYTHTNDIGGEIVAKFAASILLEKDVKPVSDFIKEELTAVEMPENGGNAALDAKQLEHIKTIGLVNVPSLEDIDKDITKI